MKTMINFLIVSSILILFSFSNAGALNAIDNFVSMRGNINDEEILFMFLIDLNGDGAEEIFLSRKNDLNGRLGNIWVVYVSKNSEYLRADNLITFNYKNLFIKKENGVSGLFTIVSPQSGYLEMEIKLSNKELLLIKSKKILFSEEEGPDEIINSLKSEGLFEVSVIKGTTKGLKEYLSVNLARDAEKK